MAEKTYTQDELAKIGQKVVEAHRKQAEKAKEARRIKSALYKLYIDGKLGDIKV